jgi:hypothetical protein
MRAAAARAANRRGSSTTILLSLADGSFASSYGSRVVLAAPGGATSTAAGRVRSAVVNSGIASSIGNGSLEFMWLRPT